jgi:hypothetical protein
VFSIFDVVNQVFIHEDKNGNVVAFVQDESLRNVMVVFSAAGNYLYHRFFSAPTNFIAETSNGNYMHASSFSNTVIDPIISYRDLTKLSNCDSTIFVSVTNGTDSASALNALRFAGSQSTPVNLAISVSNASIQKNSVCNVQTGNKKVSKKDLPSVTISPNPAFDKIVVTAKVGLTYFIYNLYGTLMMKCETNQPTDISRLNAGMYIIEIKTKNGVIGKTLLKK